MYLVAVKTVAANAMARVFDADYAMVQPDFANLLVSIEFPVQREAYPSIWVNYQPEGSLQAAGVGHFEIGDPTGANGPAKLFHRWRFSGSLSYTVVALTSLERDRLFDEVIRVIAFGNERTETSVFRSYLEQTNSLIGININADEIEQSGFDATPGTPWGTDDMIYESTISIKCLGEFCSDGKGVLADISAINVFSYSDQQADPVPEWH